MSTECRRTHTQKEKRDLCHCKPSQFDRRPDLCDEGPQPMGTRRPPTGYKPPSPLSVRPPSRHELLGGGGGGVYKHVDQKKKKYVDSIFELICHFTKRGGCSRPLPATTQ